MPGITAQRIVSVRPEQFHPSAEKRNRSPSRSTMLASGTMPRKLCCSLGGDWSGKRADRVTFATNGAQAKLDVEATWLQREAGLSPWTGWWDHESEHLRGRAT
jgi:hypothetical protein